MLNCAQEEDDYFYMMTFVSMIFFALELVLASISKENYFLGFYFWLDLVATVSLITDIGWIWNEIMGTQDVGAANADQAS